MLQNALQDVGMTANLLPVSFAQQRLWFLEQLNPGTSSYNLVRVFRVSGSLDTDALHQAFKAMVDRHEVLRTGFTAVDGRPVQVIRNHVDVDLPVLDFGDLPEPQREPRALAIAAKDA